MTHPPCDRFAVEGLSALEAGRDLPPHFYSCPECTRQRERFDSMKRAFGVTRGRGPRPGWQGLVLAAAGDGSIGARSPRSWRWLALPAFVAVAAAVILWWRAGMVMEDPTLVAWELVPGQRDPALKTRGADALSVGDVIRIRATLSGVPVAEIRVYRERGGLIHRCPGESGCLRTPERLEALWRIAAPGRYVIVATVSSLPLPEPAGDLTADLERLIGAGARVETARPLEAN